MRNFQLAVKRIFDILLALAAIVILTVIPVLIVVPIAIRLESKGKAVFRQARVGKDGKLFDILKFRTMAEPPADCYNVKGVWYKPDGTRLLPEERITKVGRFLRKTSLDELMQLFNVLNGTMSFIGPRPTLPYQVEKYTDEQKRRHELRPGITGWAQVNGRNGITWTEKIKYDLEYVDGFSLWFDIRIWLRSFTVVLRRESTAFEKDDPLTAKGGLNPDAKKALVLAGGVPQIALIEELKSRGITTVLCDGSDGAVARPYADVFYRIQIFDKEAVKEVALKEKVDFVITVCADQVLLIVAQVSEELGLPFYIDYKTAQDVSDKALMKEIFEQNQIPTSRHVVMAELDKTKIAHLEYPLVVKPVDCYSSKGVRKVLNEKELEEAFAQAVTLSRTDTAIVEEFVGGWELSVDVFVTDGRAEVLLISQSDKVADADKFVIFRGRVPADLSPELRAQVADTAQRIADAFGLRNCPMLVQMICDGKRVSVLEFCARTGGGMKFLLIRRACGVDVVKAVVDLSMGQKPVIAPTAPEAPVIVNEFLYCEPGVLDHMEGVEELLAEGLIVDHHMLKSPGFEFRGVASSSDRVCGITVEAADKADFDRKHDEIRKRLRVISSDGRDILRHDLMVGWEERSL